MGLVLIVAALGAATLGILHYLQRVPIDEPNRFVGSQACQVCHRAIYTAWYDSLHRKMMRRVDEPGAVVADWSKDDGQRGFTRDDAVWVVGSRWEQQFMGNDGQRDTLLPGAWSVAHQQWTSQGWDGWQVPVPEIRCHGCHTVGMDTNSRRFVEAGIGCESCHGKGLWHTEASGHGPIHTGLDSQDCGQCHTRGHATQGEFFFPTNYELGSKLDDKFVEIDPDYIQNSSQWWGTGRERDRHQEYPAWRRGGHANALMDLQPGRYDGRYGSVTSDCLRCHSAEGAMNEKRVVSLADAKNGVTCAVCHNVHGDLETTRTTCSSCHDQGPFHHKAVALADHVPCPASAGVDCVNCHMPITAKVGGEFRLHSHAPGITAPAQGASFDSPSSCTNGGCHQSTAVEQLQAAYDRFYRSSSESAAVLMRGDASKPRSLNRDKG
jgi:hypothetical protein